MLVLLSTFIVSNYLIHGIKSVSAKNLEDTNSFKEEVLEEEIEQETEELIQEVLKDYGKNQNNRVNVSIDKNLFSSTVCRLNTEAYEIAESVMNKKHFFNDIGNTPTIFAKSMSNYIDPLMPLSQTIVESGYPTTEYLWSNPIFIKFIIKSGVDIDTLQVEAVNEDFYIVNNMDFVFNCGGGTNGCTSSIPFHTHIQNFSHGTYKNDNDSLGTLQILRRKVEGVGGCIIYSQCGETVSDLLCWKDNVQWWFHNHIISSNNNSFIGKNHVVANEYEALAHAILSHQGAGYWVDHSKGITQCWLSAQKKFDFAVAMGSEQMVKVMQEFVDDWWEKTKQKIQNNESWNMPVVGKTWYDSAWLDLLAKGGITNIYQYCRSETFSSGSSKNYGFLVTYFPQSIITYMALQKLYYSGNL